MTFLLPLAFRATKILSTVGVDVPTNRGFHSYHWHSCSFQRYLTPGRHYASRQPLDLRNVAFGAIKSLSTVVVDNPVDRNFQSYLNPVNFKSWYSCSFQRCLTPERRCLPSTVWADNRSFQSYLKIEDAMLPVNWLSLQT